MNRRSARGAAALLTLTVSPVRPDSVGPRRFEFSEFDEGSVMVSDRAAWTAYFVYVPHHGRQFNGGHQAQRWYIRPAGEVGNRPFSRPFASFAQAIDAIRDGSWDLAPSYADRQPIRLRGEGETSWDSAMPGPTCRSRFSPSCS